MKKSDYTNPEEHIFYCDKSGWYDEINGERDWSKSHLKLDEFWLKVRKEKMAKFDYDFSQFIFPTFSKYNFWEEGEEELFEIETKALKESELNEGYISFFSATFQGRADFAGVTFQDKTSFLDATFEDFVSFYQSTFLGDTSFKFVTFQNVTSFSEATIRGEVVFADTTFQGETFFWDATFEDLAFFYRSIFQNKLHLTNFCCKEKGRLFFYQTEFSLNHISIFSQWDLGKEMRRNVLFTEVIFPDKVVFLDCDFRKVEFEHGDLVRAKFVNPDFRKYKHRTFLSNEIFVYDKKNEASKRDQKIKHLKMIGEVYRQLKRNQMEAKDWREAGDAYRSEMVIQRKLSWSQWLKGFYNPLKLTHLFNHFLNRIHGVFSGYQQSMIRPVIWLAIFWALFAFGYNWVEPTRELEGAMRDSYYALFPLSGVINVTEAYVENSDLAKDLMVLERIIGTILLTFFVLSTRARMKQ